MIVKIRETVLKYSDHELKVWSDGDKSIAPDFAPIHPIIKNQPRYHFAEMFTLRHYYELEQWKGFTSFALGPQYQGSESREAGRRKIEELVPQDRLQQLRDARSDPAIRQSGVGEPDLFLYKDDGSFMFVEVKKGSDRLRETQLTCIAQILDILKCPVSIVYLRTEAQSYTPKTYRFDLSRHEGQQIKA
jgi:hypothetical protein